MEPGEASPREVLSGPTLPWLAPAALQTEEQAGAVSHRSSAAAEASCRPLPQQHAGRQPHILTGTWPCWICVFRVSLQSDFYGKISRYVILLDFARISLMALALIYIPTVSLSVPVLTAVLAECHSFASLMDED